MYSKALSFYVLFIVFVSKVSSSVYISTVTTTASNFVRCTSICESTFRLTSNKIAKSDCCNRGCRFFRIAELVGVNKQLELNISKETCHKGCAESYRDHNDRAACSMGCDTMAKQQLEIYAGNIKEVSLSILGVNRDQPPVVQTFYLSPEEPSIIQGEFVEPDDVMMDPALKRQLIFDTVDEKKLPLVHKKTLPMNREQFDKWWADCMFKYIHHCFGIGLFAFACFFYIYYTFCNKSYTEPNQVYCNKFSDEEISFLPPK